jgi:proline dehydrogenase
MTLSTSIIRPSILLLAEHPWFRHLATRTRPGRAVASRFVAGETLEQAMLVARDLDRMRTTSMLDHLGENVGSIAQATEARDAYLAALAAIRLEPTLDIAISLKLTQLGLDRSIDECLANVEPILDAADEQGTWDRRSRSLDRHMGAIPASASRCSRTCAGPRTTCSIFRPACACAW